MRNDKKKKKALSPKQRDSFKRFLKGVSDLTLKLIFPNISPQRDPEISYKVRLTAKFRRGECYTVTLGPFDRMDEEVEMGRLGESEMREFLRKWYPEHSQLFRPEVF